MALSFPNVPGVKIDEVRLGPPAIAGVGTSTAGFVGAAPKSGRLTNQVRLVTSADQFAALYVLRDPAVAGDTDATTSTPLSRAVFGFFANGGTRCYVVNVDSNTPSDVVDGVALLQPIDEVAILAAPGHTDTTVYNALIGQAATTGDRFAILDPPTTAAITPGGSTLPDLTRLITGGANRPPVSSDSIHAAFYYPRIQVAGQLSGDPAREFVAPSGHLAGIYARVDANRGVHKAPANEVVRSALGVEQLLTDGDQDLLNPEGVNALRVFAGSTIVWGARTLQQQSSPQNADYLYVNVRRLVNYVEESLQEGLRFAVFEPNDLALRQQIVRSARGFLDRVWRDGALFGATADEAYYVRVPDVFNTDEDRALGRLTIEVGLRVTFPAEFIIIRIGVILRSAATA